MKYLLSLILILASITIQAQDKTGKSVTITTNKGDVINGVIIESDKEKMILKTAFGKAEINMDDVKKVSFGKEKTTVQVTYSELGDNNYSASHYLFSSSGFGLGKGESYYDNISLFWNTFGIGINENLSIDIAGEIISPLFFTQLPFTAITPKLSLPMEGIGAFSVGTTLFTYHIDGPQFAGSINGALTLGSKQNNITINGYIGLGSDIEINELFPFAISAMFKISDHLSFVTENWIVTGNGVSDPSEAVISANLRYHFDNNKSSFTFGLWRPTVDTGSLIAFPFASGRIGF